MVKESEWRKRFEQQKRSGLGIAAWCKQQGIRDNQYYYWQQRLGGEKPRAAAGGFVRVGSVEAVELLIGEKLRVKVPADFDGASLKRLLEVLGC